MLQDINLNRQNYQRLKAALSLNLRQQIFLAVCDDHSLRNQIANQLQAELGSERMGEIPDSSLLEPLLVSLTLNLNDPNPVSEIATWLDRHRSPGGKGQFIAPGFQILGVERLTRQPSRIQRQFLNYLQIIGQSWPLPLESSLLLWMPRPWLFSIQQSAPDFWRCRTGIFEFAGDPTPVLSESWSDENSPATIVTAEAESATNEGALVGWEPPTMSGFGQGQPNVFDPNEGKEVESHGSKVLDNNQNTSEVRSPVNSVETEKLVEALWRGNLYRDRIKQGEGTLSNMIAGIGAYEEAIEYLESDSRLWADILNDLGNLYWMRSGHEGNQELGRAYLEQGIKTYEIALNHILEHEQLEAEALSPDSPAEESNQGIPQTYTRLQHNLGAAYSALARYRDPAKNLQKSLKAYREGLDSSKNWMSDPQQTAATLNNIGTAYWHLAQHQQAVNNLKQAIEAYQKALSYYSPEQEPLNYGMIQNNLGTAYWNLGLHVEQPTTYLQMAICAYRIALQHRTATAAPEAHAATQNNLGTAYWHLAHQEDPHSPKRGEYWQQCIRAYELALETAQELETLSFDLFATHNNLGIAHYQLASESTDFLEEPDRRTHLEGALSHLSQACMGWTGRKEEMEVALGYVIGVIRTFHQEYGLSGQNQALSLVPPQLFPEIWRRL